MKNKVKLIAIAKDESAYLCEWIHHHFYFGVDAIHIAINNTNDKSIELLDNLSHHLPVTYSIEDRLSQENSFNFQSLAYQKMASIAKEEGFSHVLILDIDEFWIAKDFKTKIKEAMDLIGKADSYLFHWFRHCDEEEFSHCFKERIIGGNSPLVKSIISLNSEYETIREHNAYGELIYRTADGKEYPFSVSNKTRTRIDRELSKDLKDLPYLVVHRMYRSQMEYTSLLLRGRPRGSLIKDNRHGYCVKKDADDVLCFSSKDLQDYYQSLEELISKANVENLIRSGQDFVRQRYNNALSVFKSNKLSSDDINSLKKVLKYVELPEVKEIRDNIIKKSKNKKGPELNKITSEDISYLRDLALSLESSDIKSSLRVMEIALKLRPNGSLIKRKIKEYRNMLKDT